MSHRWIEGLREALEKKDVETVKKLIKLPATREQDSIVAHNMNPVIEKQL